MSTLANLLFHGNVVATLIWLVYVLSSTPDVTYDLRKSRDYCQIHSGHQMPSPNGTVIHSWRLIPRSSLKSMVQTQSRRRFHISYSDRRSVQAQEAPPKPDLPHLDAVLIR